VGGWGEEVSRVPLLSSYFCGWRSSFLVLASVEKKKNCDDDDDDDDDDYYYEKVCLKERLFY